jgi:CBS-domain-containing membrane protein
MTAGGMRVMNSAIERLLSLRVADIMRRNVMTVSADATMTEAAQSFLCREVSGAPVVDQREQCVGILSAVDFVRREVQGCSGRAVSRNGEDHVRTYMSPAVQSIDDHATLIDAARAMCGKHIHRLPVLDREGSLVGVISSLDLVAAVVHAIEE